MDDEKWKELCQLIMTETDPERLWRLVEQLNAEFERREEQLKRVQRSSETPGPDKITPAKDDGGSDPQGNLN
jgi:hypothetical protein